MRPVVRVAAARAKGSAGLVDLSAATDVRLMRMASHSWMSEQREEGYNRERTLAEVSNDNV